MGDDPGDDGWNGVERRSKATAPVPFKQFAVVLVATVAGIGVLFALSLNETDQANARLSRIETQVRISNDTAENARVTADFLRDCIFYAEQGHCPVKNLQIIKEDNPTGNPKPTTTTTTR